MAELGDIITVVGQGGSISILTVDDAVLSELEKGVLSVVEDEPAKGKKGKAKAEPAEGELPEDPAADGGEA